MPSLFNGPSELMTVNGNLAVNDDGTGNYGKVSGGPLGGPMLQLQASTGAGGFALQNGTPNIVSWTAPNDGALHRFVIFLYMFVTSATTGGAISIVFTDPGGNAQSPVILSATQGGGAHGTTSQGFEVIFAKAGTTVTISESSAMTAGAATVWAEIWAS